MQGNTRKTLAEEIIALARLIFVSSRQAEGCNPPLPRAYAHDFQALYVLNNHPNPRLTMSQLAEELVVSKQQISKLIGNMEEKGLVTRQHDAVNRRQVYVNITPQGQALMEQTLQDLRQWITQETQAFSDLERQQLHQSVQVFSTLLQKRLQIAKPEQQIREDA